MYNDRAVLLTREPFAFYVCFGGRARRTTQARMLLGNGDAFVGTINPDHVGPLVFFCLPMSEEGGVPIHPASRTINLNGGRACTIRLVGGIRGCVFCLCVVDIARGRISL